MTTISELVKQAMREGNLIALSTDLTDDEQSEAITLLNRFLDSLYGSELGEFTQDWPVPPTHTSPVAARQPQQPRSEEAPSDVWPYPPGNVNIVLNLVSDTTIYMPQTPQDGARMTFANAGDGATYTLTVDGNGRKVNGADTVTATPAVFASQQWLYRADLGDWVALSILGADDESPLPAVYDDLLALGTFIRLAPRYGRSMSSESAVTYKRILMRFKNQYRQTVDMPSQKPQVYGVPQSSANGTFFSGGFK
jgi:hypothetical protein